MRKSHVVKAVIVNSGVLTPAITVKILPSASAIRVVLSKQDRTHVRSIGKHLNLGASFFEDCVRKNAISAYLRLHDVFVVTASNSTFTVESFVNELAVVFAFNERSTMPELITSLV